MPSDALSSWSAKSSKSSKAFPCLPDSPQRVPRHSTNFRQTLQACLALRRWVGKKISNFWFKKVAGFTGRSTTKVFLRKHTSTNCWCSLEQSGISHGHSSTINHCQLWTSKNSRFIVRPQLRAVSKQWPWKSKSQRTKTQSSESQNHHLRTRPIPMLLQNLHLKWTPGFVPPRFQKHTPNWSIWNRNGVRLAETLQGCSIRTFLVTWHQSAEQWDQWVNSFLMVRCLSLVSSAWSQGIQWLTGTLHSFFIGIHRTSFRRAHGCFSTKSWSKSSVVARKTPPHASSHRAYQRSEMSEG